MNKLRAWLASCGVLALLFVPSIASADVSDFVITSFTADETLSRHDPQGELRVVERINVNFNDYNHGLLRAIPNSYKHHSLQLKVNNVSSDTGAPAQHTAYTSNGNTVLKIGDPDRTVTGAQEYTIDYTLHNVISFYDDHDELYWDVNGDKWQQQFQKVSATIHLPNDLRQNRRPLCYAGAYGSNGQECNIESHNNTLTTAAAQPLPIHQTLTYVAGFDRGYFRPSKWYETLAEHQKQITGFVLPLLIIGASSGWLWWRRGRDVKGRGIIVPQYDAPAGMTPIEVGTLIDFKTDNRDITAMIVDLAIRKFITIIEKKEVKKLRKDSLSYELELIKNDFSGLSADESMLLKELFDQQVVGETASLSKSKTKLYNLAVSLRKNVKSRLKDQGYLRVSPLSAGKVVRTILLGFLLLIAGFIAYAVFGISFIAGLAAGVLVAIPFWFAMDARTAKGVEAKEHVEGLKMYLTVAEKDRIAKLQAPNAPYAINATQPVKTVDLFEKLLPYAMVLGVENEWAKQFEGLYQNPPDWYSGNWTTFNAAYLASSLSDGVGQAVNTAFSSPSSSGSSGFGGGFSGGGGGGGGGGGW